MSNKQLNPWDLDIRVRERNLRNGMLSDKDVEKMMSQLPDLVEQTEPVSVGQPALEAADSGDDEDEGEG